MEIFRYAKIAKHLRQIYFVLAIVLVLSLELGFAQKAIAQVPTPLAGLEFLTQITIPNWTTTGAATQASTDIWSFDPSTNTLYFADWVNRGVSVVDTNTNTYLGTIVIPSCNVAGAVPGLCPSGVLVVLDLHKLVI